MRQTTPVHDYAAIFPLTEGQPLWDLSDRIKLNGLREPIVLLDGKILDGRRRELGCLRAGVDPKYRKFGSRKEDGNDPLEFVIDLNLHRRHLGEGDRALAAARYATAKKGANQHNGRSSQNETTSPTKRSSQNETTSPTKRSSQNETTSPTKRSSQNETTSPTNKEAAEKFEVSEAKVDRAKKVIANGTEKLQEAVANDEISVSDAARVANQPPDVQDAAVEAVREGAAKTATKAAEQIVEPETLKDANGFPVPDKCLPAFEAAKEIGKTCKEIDKIISRVEELGKGPGGRMMHTTSQMQTLQNVRKSLWQSRATHVCPYCKGEKKLCNACAISKEDKTATGWTTKTSFDGAPAEMKKEMQVA